MPDISVGRMVTAVRRGIGLANLDDDDPHKIAVQSFELELKVQYDKAAGVDASVKVFEVDVGASRERKWTNIHTLTLSLEPDPAHDVRLLDAQEDEIVDAIQHAAKSIRGAIATAQLPGEPGGRRYDLDEATVEMSFVVTDTGRIEFLAYLDVSKEISNTITLTIGRNKPPKLEE